LKNETFINQNLITQWGITKEYVEQGGFDDFQTCHEKFVVCVSLDRF